MGYGLKACKSIPPQHGVISAPERGHLESYFFRLVVLQRAEYYVKLNFSRTPCFTTWDNPSKGGDTLLDATLVYLHFIERVFVDEVQSAAAIHEYFSEAKAVYNWGTKAASARSDRALSPSLALKVIAISFQGFIAAT